MGVVKKLLGGGNLLGPVRHHHLFLDMEENIHIHYRDLRIEMSRGEFEEFCNTFDQQSRELLAIIRSRNYQDGQLPNANQEDVRIWTESKLSSEVKYHPTRVALEECNDGYHMHLRNYKLLFSREEFVKLVETFGVARLDGPYASSLEEVLSLLEANDLHFEREALEGAPPKLRLRVEAYHFRKLESIFRSLPFERAALGDYVVYKGESLIVEAEKKPDTSVPIASPGTLLPVTDFLARQAKEHTYGPINRIKLQAANMLCQARQGDGTSLFNPDYRSWLVDHKRETVVFPYAPAPRYGNKALELFWNLWSSYLQELGLHMAKPRKALYTREKQDKLAIVVRQLILDKVATPCPAVTRIYLMGSAARKQLGIYDVPFVMASWAKLGSDIDILIELKPDQEGEIPAEWEFIQHAPNTCDVYHIGQLRIAGGDKVADASPFVKVWHHLLEAYLFRPSTSDRETTDAFLREQRALLMYDREREAKTTRLQSLLETLYPITEGWLEAMDVPTENNLYQLRSERRNLVFKVFAIGGNYPKERLQEHVDYEAELVNEAVRHGIPTAAVVPSAGGKLVENFDGQPMVAFEYLPGRPCHGPDCPLEAIAQALARYHRVQLEQPFELPQRFTFEDIANLWWPTLERYRQEHHEPEVADWLELLGKRLPKLRRDCANYLQDNRFAVHNHGDVNARNVLIDDKGIVFLFDFQNAFYGGRLLDVIDGAYEFSLAGLSSGRADFGRFERFIAAYLDVAGLEADELALLTPLTGLVGILKFTKEIGMAFLRPEDKHRRQRALEVARFVHERESAEDRPNNATS